MKRAVIIVAAGTGSRMGGKLPKQYLKLDGIPLIVYTLEKFRRFDPEMLRVVVIGADQRELWENTTKEHELGDILVADGGAHRYHSVKNGLALIGEGVLVGIHDAVRPLVSQQTLTRAYDAAAEKGSGIPVIEMEESVRMLDQQKKKSTHLDRSRLMRVQTPQVFRSELIKKAFLQEYTDDFTDDASVYEAAYGQVALVEGNRENIKITTPTDLELASLLIRSVK